jgi:ankyrin repeat protein
MEAEEAEFQYTPLVMAVVMDNHWVAAELISCGADVRRMTSRGNSAIRVAAERGNLQLLATAVVKYPDVINAIYNTSLNSQLLEIAIAFKQHHVIRFLIDQGADLGHINGEGFSPAIIAAFNGDEYALLMLLKAKNSHHQVMWNSTLNRGTVM